MLAQGMNFIDWVFLYFGGVILGIIMVLVQRGDRVLPREPGKRLRWLPTVLGIVFWFLLLPFSFVALWLNICLLLRFEMGFKWGLWVFSFVFKDLSFEYKGRTLVKDGILVSFP